MFPKAIADLIGWTREAVQHLVDEARRGRVPWPGPGRLRRRPRSIARKRRKRTPETAVDSSSLVPRGGPRV